MKRVGIIILTILIAVSFTALAIAQEKPAKPAVKPVEEKVIEHKGTISKIDEKRKTFTVKDEKGIETTMVVDDMKMPAGLQVGDKVVCKHVVKGKKNICKEVIKEPAPTK